MKSPYETLGVPKTADAATIRRAHRQRAKQHHPDAGGNEAAMREVNEAYLILRDPARRQHFDETGEAEQRDSAVTDLIAMFISACEVEQSDMTPLELVRLKLQSQLAIVQKEQRILTSRARHINRMAAKVTVRQGPNLLGTALENHAANLERKAASAVEELARIERMTAILKEYDFIQEQPISIHAFKVKGQSPFETLAQSMKFYQ